MRNVVIVLLAVGLVVALPAAAQDDEETPSLTYYAWDMQSITFGYPDEWTHIDIDDQSGSIRLSQVARPNSDDDMLFVFSSRWALALYPPDVDVFSAELLMQGFFTEFGFDADTVLSNMADASVFLITEYTTEDGGAAYLVTDETPRGDVAILALIFPNNGAFAEDALLVARSLFPTGEVLSALEIIEGANESGDPPQTPTPAADPIVIMVDCQVQTDVNDVRLRVGPGLNRGVVIFMPVDRPITATAQAIGADNLQWYRLDPAEAAPDSEAEEVWVAAEIVTTTGTCANLPTAKPPPLNPFDRAN